MTDLRTPKDDEFVCSKCRYYGEGMWSQCAACEAREALTNLNRFKNLAVDLLLALGPLGDPELAQTIAQRARDLHRALWGSIELYDQKRVDGVRSRHARLGIG